MASKKKPISKPSTETTAVKHQETPTAAVNTTPTKDFINDLGSKGIFLALAILIIIALIVFKNYLGTGKIYSFTDIASDSFNLSYPNIVNTTNYIHKYGIPKWSFHSGMGQSIFPFFLRDPFSLYFYMGSADAVGGKLITVELIKIIASGILFYYLLKLIKFSNYSSIIGAICYSFSGFMIMGSAWYGFTYEALNLTIMLIAFELLYQFNKWWLFPVSIFLIGISMPFNIYFYGLFLATYVLLRLSQDNQLNLKNIGLLYGKMIALGSIGLLISGPFLLENIIQLLESPRVGGTNSFADVLSKQSAFATTPKQELGTSLLRFFSNDILGSGDNFRGAKNILEAPSFYCGIACLVVMPQVFNYLNKSQKIFFASFIGLWLLPTFFPYFRYAIWLFSGDYYRGYAFFVAIIFIYYTVIAIDKLLEIKKINLITLVITTITLLGILSYPYFEDSEIVNGTVKGFALLMVIVYAAITYLLTLQKNNTGLKYALLGILIFEIIYISGITTNNWNAFDPTEKEGKNGYNDYSVDAINYIKQIDNSFYRIDKSYGSSTARFMSINDGLAQDYNGTSSYNPFNQLNYIYYMQRIAVADKKDENTSRWCMGLLNRPIIESPNQVKYILTKDVRNPIWQIMCDSIKKVGDVTVFKNKYSVPFGQTYNTYITESEYERCSIDQKSFLTLRTCVIPDNYKPSIALPHFNFSDTTTPFNFDLYRSYVDEISKETLSTTTFDDNHIQGNITISQDKMMYLSIPYDDGWHAYVDNTPVEKIKLSSGMTGLAIKAGKHRIELKYELRYWSKGMMMSGIGILLLVGLTIINPRVNKKRSNLS